ncbi:translation initiation factor IF-2 [Robiginitomaculum antarcticum]|uniref:translation initiation factor IF-2 n=1 Tax=Robiginitomaculum antarcticum TaxID=437507 RepID=UPI00036CA822|nr:translation initiation factor IF-2 [Robiginitomaculum antarcticum]
MTDNNDTSGGNNTGGRKPLSLKAKSGGTVRQNFSHGRSKSVVVEKKKRRVIGGPGKPAPAPEAAPAPSKPRVDEDAIAARKMGLSKTEYVKRKQALGAAQAVAADRAAAQQAEAEDRKQRAEEERTALEQKRIEEERAAEDEKRQAEREASTAKKESEAPRRTEARAEPEPKPEARNALEAMGGRVKQKRQQPSSTSKPSRNTREQPRRRRKLTIVSALADNEERQRSLASVKRARQREKERRSGGDGGDKKARQVVVPETISIADLANRMAERGSDVVKYLIKQGTMAQINDLLDADTAQLIVEDFGHSVKRVADSDVEDNFLADRDDDDPKDMKPRAPVIAVMGHVDHGKTSLLDALRKEDVASGEAGGITQHIGAYQLKLKDGKKITVLDTPGHSAFSAMRTRGAAAVDIVILVVAADDGVMPQTIESISHARASGAPIIVAINKMDVPGANPQKVETDLLQHEIITESMSGETQAIPVSAKTGEGLDALLEAINLQAELMELKANPKRAADGLVIESKVEKGRGSVATLLVKRGNLKRGDIIVAGDYWGKVKALTDERSARIKQALPSMAIEVMGLDGAPDPGEPFGVVENETQAREITQYRQRARRDTQTAPTAMASMEQMMAKLQEKQISDMPLLVKGDVQGSVEAIKASVEGMGNDEVRARVIYGAAGGISESDILLAKASEAPVIAFNVRANRQAKDLAEREGVEIRYYSIIYDLIDDVKGVLEGMLDPERRETFLGYATVKEVFDISKLGNIAGCLVTEGMVKRGSGVRLLRDDVVIHEGELSTLRRFKDEVDSVVSGTECGIGFKNYHDIKKGDQVECFSVEYLKRNLDEVNKAEAATKKAEAKAQKAADAAAEAEAEE